MPSEFGVMALVLGVSVFFGIAAKILKLPAILGFIVAGMVLGGVGRMEFLGKLGVTLLLFLVGLELPIADLKKFGKTALLTGLGQVTVTTWVGFGLARFLGFSTMEAVYIGVALTFSSTIVIVKLLSEKGDLNSLHGRIAVGSLLVQDFVAIGILIVLGGLGGEGSVTEILKFLVKGMVAVGVVLFLAEKIMPVIVKWLSRWGEVLFLFSVAWCLSVAALVSGKYFGLSSEMGGFLAGLALATAAAHYQITARVRPLRDFFLVLFFVSMGQSVSLGTVAGLWMPVVILSVYVIVGNPLIMMVILGLLGYKKRTAFLAGVTMGQISEFSLVVVAAAVASGQVGNTVLSLVTIVGLLTMTVGSFLVTYSEKIYKRVESYLPFWGPRKRESGVGEAKRRSEIILFGHSRTGSGLRPALERMGKLVIVDFDPEVVEGLQRAGLEAVYGDLSDPEIYDELGVGGAKMVVSTVPDKSDSMQLLNCLRGDSMKNRPLVVVTAMDGTDAREMYGAGADYVLVPHKVGGEFLGHLLERVDIREYGKKHRERLK